MAIRDNQQNDNLPFNYNMTGSGAEFMVIPAMGCQRLFDDSGTWKEYDHSGNGNHLAIAGGVYYPKFTARFIKVEGAAHQVKYEMASNKWPGHAQNATICLDLYAVEVLHKIQLTAVYCDADTTVDAITLYF